MKDEIRWLHLSDFHSGKDDYGQRRLFDRILKHVEKRIDDGLAPSFVVLTGDVANSGKLDEYEMFIERFLLPLYDLLGPAFSDRVFIVPGNHDADRDRCRAVRKIGVLDIVPEILDPTKEGLAERRSLLGRFEHFTSLEWGDRAGWLSSSEGCFTSIFEVGSCKIGILGLNTAWLSEKGDRHQLTPGKGMLESGLDTLETCDLRIVLGHHPLDWMLDGEVEGIKAILARKGAIYLHGHLHKSRQRIDQGSGIHFATIQSGAGFQAREDEKWVNGFICASASLKEKRIYLEPFVWSKDNHEWAIDSTAFPSSMKDSESERWALDIPISLGDGKIEVDESAKPGLYDEITSKGWEIIDKDFLRSCGPSGKEEQLGFFNGAAPNWSLALTPAIPKRAIVEKISKSMIEMRSKTRTGFVLIGGPGGEGKSTVLRQTLVELVANQDDWKVLWRTEENSALAPVDIMKLAAKGGTWVIATDDANLFAENAFKLLKHLHDSHRGNFLFLFCSTDSDWFAAGGSRLPWNKYADTKTIHIKGIAMDDALCVVTAWERFGKEGMRALYGTDSKEAAKRLLQAAKKASPIEEGAFLGALLRTRLGEEGLKDHIRLILDRFKNYKIPGGDLLWAFSHVVALHVEEISLLTKEVLARALNLPVNVLNSQVIGPMKGEAVTYSGYRILVRHKAIADFAADILENEFYIDLDDIRVSLVRSAREAYVAGETMREPGEWAYLSRTLYDKGRKHLSIRMARVVHEVEPKNPYFIVQLANLYRKSSQHEEAVGVFRKGGAVADRAYYYEWGTAEGFIGNYGIGAWLDAYAMSDYCAPGKPNRQRTVYCLNGLVVAYRELYKSYGLSLFSDAGYVCAYLSKNIDNTGNYTSASDAKAIRDCLGGKSADGLNLSDPSSLLGLISKASTEAWERRETDLDQLNAQDDPLEFEWVKPLIIDM